MLLKAPRFTRSSSVFDTDTHSSFSIRSIRANPSPRFLNFPKALLAGLLIHRDKFGRRRLDKFEHLANPVES